MIKISSHSDEKASEPLENIREMFPLYYITFNVISRLTFQTTQWYANRCDNMLIY